MINNRGLLSEVGLVLCSTCSRRFTYCRVRYRVVDRSGFKRMLLTLVNPITGYPLTRDEMFSLPCIVGMVDAYNNFLIDKKKIDDEISKITDMRVSP